MSPDLDPLGDEGLLRGAVVDGLVILLPKLFLSASIRPNHIAMPMPMPMAIERFSSFES